MTRVLGLWLILLTTGCHDQDELSQVRGRLRFEVVPRLTPPALSLSQYADGSTVTARIRLVNDSRIAVQPTWSTLSTPFSAALPATVDPGATELELRFTASQPGTFRTTLTASHPGYEPGSISLTFTALPIPLCTPSATCTTASFDTALGRCVERSAPDGSSCDPGTVCVTTATCQAGRCVGAPVVCDDGNACTVDVCQVETGCEFLPAPPCPGDGACQVGVCEPSMGCTLVPAADGSRCGTTPTTCRATEVCIAGACVVRNPPDGFVCQEASPCQAEGRCVADACVVPGPPRTLAASWTLDSAAPGPLGTLAPYHDFVMERSGAVSLSSFFASPVLVRANRTAAPAPEGPARRCILWNGLLVCADYPSAPNGKVSAIDPATGATRWTFDVRVEKPDFLAQTSTIFLARLVVQGPDRLAALFEAYPLRPPSNNGQCRMYFLIVMDAAGKLVMAQPVTDPLLEVCDHPHPYGVAADSLGNLYIAFSPSVSPAAPLIPDVPTLLVSYTHDGVFRWKHLDTSMRGGELAVAQGLLYPENSSVVRRVTTGEAAFALPSELGRAVISRNRLIPAPVDRGVELAGYEAGAPAPRWAHALPPGLSFWGEQLRLGTMATSRGPRTVALAFVTEPAGGRGLYAVDAENGQGMFHCPVDLPSLTVPQLMEVGQGRLVVMDSALDAVSGPSCGKCDPPFAGSAATFREFETPGLTIAEDPWVGTFGGAGHDHQEQ